MAQFTLVPPPTKKEMGHAAQLVREAMASKSYRTQEETARALGLQSSELSRLLKGVEQRWGFWRISKLAAMLGTTVDGVLGRKDGTTQVLQAGGRRAAAEPVVRAVQVAVSRKQAWEISQEIVREGDRLQERVTRAARQCLPSVEAKRFAEEVDRIVDDHRKRISELRARLTG